MDKNEKNILTKEDIKRFKEQIEEIKKNNIKLDEDLKIISKHLKSWDYLKQSILDKCISFIIKHYLSCIALMISILFGILIFHSNRIDSLAEKNREEMIRQIRLVFETKNEIYQLKKI